MLCCALIFPALVVGLLPNGLHHRLWAPEFRETTSDAKYFLQVGYRVAGVGAGNPKLCAATSQQSSEVICLNQNPFIYCQGNHFLRGASTIEIPFKLWIAIHLMKKVI
jgi:hypothetical protein